MHASTSPHHWVDAYLRQPLTVDRLPYTSELTRIREEVSMIEHYPYSDAETYWRLQSMRKRGELPRRERGVAR